MRIVDFLLNYKSIIELLALIATIVGAFSVPFAIFLFYHERKKQRFERELTTYNELAKEYRDYLKLCIEHQELHIYNCQPNTNPTLNPDQTTKRLIIFNIVASIFETAFFHYRSQSTKFKKAQWSGWNEYISDWCKREDFRAAWKNYIGTEFDKDFVSYVNNIVNEIERVGPPNQNRVWRRRWNSFKQRVFRR